MGAMLSNSSRASGGSGRRPNGSLRIGKVASAEPATETDNIVRPSAIKVREVLLGSTLIERRPLLAERLIGATFLDLIHPSAMKSSPDSGPPDRPLQGTALTDDGPL